MATPAVILRELHRLRRFAKDLQTKIGQGPRTLQLQHARAARQEETLRQTQELLKKLKVTIHDKEMTLKTTQQQIVKYQEQQNQAGSTKEYTALKHEIEGSRKKVQQIEDDILGTMGESEEQAARLPELEQAARQVKEEVARFERDQQTHLAEFAEQLRKTRQQLAEVEATLPPDVLAQYSRQVAARDEDALAAVTGRSCSACYTGITAQNYNDLVQGNFVICKSCGRMLYLPE